MTAKVPFPCLLTSLEDDEKAKAYFDALLGAISPKKDGVQRWRYAGFNQMWKAVFSLRDGTYKTTAVIDMIFATGDVLNHIWTPFSTNGGRTPGLFKHAAQNFDLAGYYLKLALLDGEKGILRLQLGRMLAYEYSAHWWNEIIGSRRMDDPYLAFNGWREAQINLNKTVLDFELPKSVAGLRSFCGFIVDANFMSLSAEGVQKMADLVSEAKEKLAEQQGKLVEVR